MVTPEIVEQIRLWLGPKGVSFFREIREKYGRIDALWIEGGILPHPVHFREGVQIRNQLRALTNSSWTAHEYDNHWVEVIELAIGMHPTNEQS
jgi:hypothetical protein